MRGIAIGRSIADVIADRRPTLILPENLPTCSFGEILSITVTRDRFDVSMFGSYVMAAEARVRLTVTDFALGHVGRPVGLDSVFNGFHYRGTLHILGVEARYRPGLENAWDIEAISTDLTTEFV